MKKKFYVIAVLVILFTACGSNGGKKFIGEWKAPSGRFSFSDCVVTISENGSNYKITYKDVYNGVIKDGILGGNKGEQFGDFKNAEICNYDSKTDMLGNIGYDKERNTLLIGGEEYTKVK